MFFGIAYLLGKSSDASLLPPLAHRLSLIGNQDWEWDTAQANQSRVWWNADQSTMMGTDSLMGYLMSQPEYAMLTNGTSTHIISTIFQNLTGMAAPQEVIDHYVSRVEAGTLHVRGVLNKMLGEFYLSPRGDGSLGTVAGFTDNRSFLDGETIRGYLDRLDAVDGIDIANLDSNGNLIELVGITG